MSNSNIPKTFTQIMTQMQQDPLASIPEELLINVKIKSEAYKQHLLKKLRWIIFQYERDMFLNQEMIEFLKWGDPGEVELLHHLLYKLRINPMKKSWMATISAYKGAKPPNVKFPDIGKMIATNFFKTIQIEKIDRPTPIVNQYKINQSRPKNFFNVIKDAKQEHKRIFDLKFRPHESSTQQVNKDSPSIIKLHDNVQGTYLKQTIPVPKFFDRSKILNAINQVPLNEFKPPIFKRDIVISICDKFYLSKRFGHGKGQLDPPDIVISTNDYSYLMPNLVYNHTKIENLNIYCSKMIMNVHDTQIENYRFGVDILMVDKKLTIPNYWRMITPIMNGFMILAPDLDWNGCMAKIKRSRRNFIESNMEKDEI